MYLQKLAVINFKNYLEAEFEFSNSINCFTGNNGVGKTNILDAIHYLSLCKSYFNSVDSQNINRGKDFFVIDGNFNIREKEEKIYCGLKKNQKKKFSRNKKEYKKLSDHIGFLPVVMVSPSDIKLIIDGSEERRKFFDSVISQYDKTYLDSLIKYNLALQQRNALLKSFYEKNNFDANELEIWDFQLIQHGEMIHEKRKLFISEIEKVFQNYYGFISEHQEEVKLHYKSDLLESDFESLLKGSRDKDRILQYTSKGTHRDDLIMELQEIPIKKSGSQGQQKTYLVALKLAKYDFIKSKTNQKPILLLDDIFDKFDSQRVEKIIQLIGEDNFGQIFMTDTDPERLFTILSEVGHDYKLFNIDNNREIHLIS